MSEPAAIVFRDALIGVGVTTVIGAAITAVSYVRKVHKAQIRARLDEYERHESLELRRDQVLQNVQSLLKDLSGDLKDLSGDMRCFYKVTQSQLDAHEISLRAIAGHKMNGEVSRAIEQVREAKVALADHLVNKAGCSEEVS